MVNIAKQLLKRELQCSGSAESGTIYVDIYMNPWR